MSLNIYKPNKSNSGFAFSFSQGLDKRTQEPVLYMRAIGQYSWDDKKRIGSFFENRENPEKHINLKFNEFECGSIISCLQNRHDYESFHKYEDNQTIIRFTPWDKSQKIKKLDPKTKEFKERSQVIPAFGISVTRNGNQTFKISLEPGEVECIKIYLSNILKNIYEARLEKIKKLIRANSKEANDTTRPPF